MSERQESKLKRNLGFWDLMVISIGQIIGAGIMSSTGIAIGMTGTGVVLAYALAPALTLICIFPLVMMGSAVPTTGGQYRYASRMLGKDAGVFYIFLYVFTNCFISVYALSFAAYFCSMVSWANERVVAVSILTLFFVTNLIGTKAVARVNKITTVILIGGLLLFTAFGLPKVDLGYVFNRQNMFNHGFGSFISTLALLYAAVVGAQCIVDLGGEAKNPSKNIPRVVIISTLSVGVLYVLIAMVASGVLPISQVENQTLAIVAGVTMPKAFFYVFMIGAALGATASAINSQFSWVTKPLLVACDDGLLPKSMGTVSEKGVPYKCLIFFYLVNVLPIAAGLDLATLQKFVTANSLISKVFIALALIRLAKQFPGKLAGASFKMSAKACISLSVLSIVVLCLLSLSLLLNLSVYAICFVLGALVLSAVYSRTFIRDLKLPDDLTAEKR